MSKIVRVQDSDYKVRVQDNGNITLYTGPLTGGYGEGNTFVSGSLTVDGGNLYSVNTQFNLLTHDAGTVNTDPADGPTVVNAFLNTHTLTIGDNVTQTGVAHAVRLANSTVDSQAIVIGTTTATTSQTIDIGTATNADTQIVNIADSTVTASSQTTNLSTEASTLIQTINVGTNAGVVGATTNQIINVGNLLDADTQTIVVGTTTATTSQDITIGQATTSAQTISVGTTSSVATQITDIVDNVTATASQELNIANETVTPIQTLLVGNSAVATGTQTLSIGNLTGTTTTQNVNIANSLISGIQTVNIANAQSGTDAQVITVGASTTTTSQTVNVADTVSTAAQHINVGTNALTTTQSINVGTSVTASASQIVNIATSSSPSQTMSIGESIGATVTQDISLGTTLASTGSQTIVIADAPNVTQTVTIGTSTLGSTINIGTGATASASTKTINIGTSGAAGSTTNVNLATGSGTGGTTTVGSATVLGEETTQNLWNTVATTVNAFGAATAINIGTGGQAGGLTTIDHDLTVSGNTVVNGDLTVNGATTTVNSTTLTVDDKNIELASTASPTDALADGGGITLKGTTDKTFNWVDATDSWTSSENVDVATGKTYKVNTVDVLTVDTLYPTQTTVNIAPAGTDVQVGAATGTTNINNNLDVDLDVNIDGANLTTSQATFNLLNTTATTVNFAGAATAVEIGSATGTTSVNNNLNADQDVNIDGANLTTSSPTINVFDDNAFTINLGTGDATSVFVGAAGQAGSTTINHDLSIVGDLTTNQTTFNILPTTATTINIGAAANDVNIGSTTGNTNTLNDLIVANNATINGTGFIKIPVGTDVEQPGQVGQPAAAAGQIRFNSTIGAYEGFDGIRWKGLGGAEEGETSQAGSHAEIIMDTFDSTLYRSAEYTIHMQDVVSTHLVKIMVIHNEYFVTYTKTLETILGGECATIDTRFNGTDIEIALTPASYSDTIEIQYRRTLINNTTPVIGELSAIPENPLDMNTTYYNIDLAANDNYEIDLNLP